MRSSRSSGVKKERCIPYRRSVEQVVHLAGRSVASRFLVGRARRL
jgi:hypothetical protein